MKIVYKIRKECFLLARKKSVISRPSTFHPRPSTFDILPSTFDILPSTLDKNLHYCPLVSRVEGKVLKVEGGMSRVDCIKCRGSRNDRFFFGLVKNIPCEFYRQFSCQSSCQDDSRRARGEGVGGHKACKDAMGLFRFSHLPKRCKNNDYLN